MKLSEEKLMAFVDGELSAEEAEGVKRELETNEQYQRKVNEFKQTRQLLNDAYSDILQEPVPQKFLDMLAPPCEQQTKTQTENIVDLSVQRKAKFTSFRPMQQVAIAASVALVIGGLVGHQMGSGQSDITHQLAQADAGFVVVGNPLHQALESTPSNTIYAAASAGGDFIKPIMSFKSTDDRYCREFEINADSSISVGVACRSNEQWQVEVLLAAGQRPAGSVDYQPASGFSEAALTAVLDNLWSGDAFDAQQESQLISNRWR